MVLCILRKVKPRFCPTIWKRSFLFIEASLVLSTGQILKTSCLNIFSSSSSSFDNLMSFFCRVNRRPIPGRDRICPRLVHILFSAAILCSDCKKQHNDCKIQKPRMFLESYRYIPSFAVISNQSYLIDFNQLLRHVSSSAANSLGFGGSIQLFSYSSTNSCWRATLRCQKQETFFRSCLVRCQ